MLPDPEEMKKFVQKIPPTAAGKLDAMNELVFKEKNPAQAFKQMALFFEDLMRSKPDYFEALKNCRTEEEIKAAAEAYFKAHPEMIEEVMMSILAVKRDRWEEKEEAREKS